MQQSAVSRPAESRAVKRGVVVVAAPVGAVKRRGAVAASAAGVNRRERERETRDSSFVDLVTLCV